MNLSNVQLQVMKTWVISNNNGNFDQSAVDKLNAKAAPDFTVWRTEVSTEEVMQNGFDWVRVDNLSVGKARIWEWLHQFGYIDPSKVNVRAGIDETWKGTQADLDVRAAVYVHCKRVATVAEKMYAVGTGSNAAPATMATGAEGLVTYDNVVDADHSA